MRTTTAVDSLSREAPPGAGLRSALANRASPAGRRAATDPRVPGGRWRFRMLTAVPAWLVSTVLHALLLIVLACIIVEAPPPRGGGVLHVSPALEDRPQVAEFAFERPVDPSQTLDMNASLPVAQPQAAEIPAELAAAPTVTTDIDSEPISIDLADFGSQTVPRQDIMTTVGALAGGGLVGRSASQRAALVQGAGGTPASERAVALALRWLAAHQLPDGRWDFDHRGGECQGRCPDHGLLEGCPVAATALGLLPFLGAGQTHQEGEYQRQVRGGLDFLRQSMQSNGSLAQGGGTMYAHGLAAIALCEAYAMTQDRELMPAAQASLNFIVTAQDPVGGGWRYAPGQPGDTSVVGWQLMALKSGHMAYLQVPPATVLGASRFLDSVQLQDGAVYKYMSHLPPRETTTAVGLLCRMYLGWDRKHTGLKRGVALLGRKGPSRGDLYFNYYATQVLRHWGGDEWVRWNSVMRDRLVESQNRSGHTAGSWIVPPDDDRGVAKGGRLYCTSLCTMILEVYYRHMPLYGESAADSDFPLR